MRMARARSCRKIVASPEGWSRTKVARSAASTIAARRGTTIFGRIKKRAPRTGPSGYNDETDCLERPACAEASAAGAGEAEALLQEVGVRCGRARVSKAAAWLRRARDVVPTTEEIARAVRQEIATGCKTTHQTSLRKHRASGVVRQIHAVVEFRNRLTVEDVEDVRDQRQARAAAERDREAGVEVSLVVRRTTAARAARGQVVLVVAVSRELITLTVERQARLPVGRSAEVESLGHSTGNRVAAIELQRVP